MNLYIEIWWNEIEKEWIDEDNDLIQELDWNNYQ
jgi:hypothetical protein